jgi:CRP/FNR family transcriptional regulator, cyclic AMP receptor protein
MARRRTSDYLDHLANVPLFTGLSKRDLQRVARVSEEVSVEPGRILVDQGRTGHEFFLILDGRASVKKNNRKTAELGRGHYFGELALLDRGPRTATVTADGDMTLLVLGHREFSSVVDGVPGLARKLLASMASRLREADTRALSH